MRQPKPLSKKPLGYMFAFLGGTIGAPIGWIASPLTLLILNRTLKGGADKQPNRFLVWTLIGIVGAPISLAMSLAALYFVFPHAPYDPDTGVVNRTKFERLQAGMPLSDVKNIVGDTGEDLGEDDVSGGKKYVFGDRFQKESIEAIFKGGKLIHKKYWDN